VREFVRERPRAFRPAGEQVLDHGGVAPGEEPVEVAKLDVELVVFLGRDDDDVAAVERDEVLDRVGEIERLLVAGDLLAVLHAEIEQAARQVAVDEDARDDQRAEEVALAAFVDAEVGLEHLGVVDLVVAELRLADDFRLDGELDELLRARPCTRSLPEV
jgi:hypothetical protein